MRNQTRQRLAAGTPGQRAIRQHQKGRAIIDSGGIAGGHRTALFLERRLHLGECFEAGRFRMLVGIKNHITLATLQGHRNNLRLETPLGNRPRSALLRLKRKGVLLFAADAPFGGLIFSGHSHVAGAEGISQHGYHHVEHLGVAHARTAAHGRRQVTSGRHHFDAATEADFNVAQHDVLRHIDNRLHGRTAQAVAGHYR